MNKADRFGRILERLADDGSVTVAALAAELDASEATVRRDLRALDDQRLLERSHGGAVSPGTVYELGVRHRGGHARAEKQAIARAALDRVRDGDVVALTGGTTTTEVTRRLVQRDGLSVVTNALNIAAELAVRPDIKLIVTGGAARSESYELVGPLAEATLAGMNLDLAVVGVDGITVAGGLTTHHDIEAHTNRVLIGRARHVIVVADGSKVGRLAFARICDVSSVHELITDASAPAPELQRLADAGIVITTV